jgi:hypothetical protein
MEILGLHITENRRPRLNRRRRRSLVRRIPYHMLRIHLQVQKVIQIHSQETYENYMLIALRIKKYKNILQFEAHTNSMRGLFV